MAMTMKTPARVCAIEIGKLRSKGIELNADAVRNVYDWARKEGLYLSQHELIGEVRRRLKDAIVG